MITYNYSIVYNTSRSLNKNAPRFLVYINFYAISLSKFPRKRFRLST